MSMLSQFGHLWKMFIRPTRQEYSKGDLGHEISVFGKYKSKRTDCVVLNKKQEKLQCSLFEPISLESDNLQGKFPCVIYCHCNSGSRLEALRLLPQIIQQGMGLFCFDFSGSGLSEGEYVTLGINESHDLECVVNHLVSQGKVSNIALWGRSMGAVTCILYMGMKTCHNAVKAIVFDSGFSNMNQLTLDLAKQKTGMPNMFIEPALYLVNDQIRERVDVDIKSIDLAKTIHSVYVPIHFVCSKEDTFVKCDHSERLYDRYNGLKWIEHTTGGHNAHRSNEIIEMLVDWISYFLIDRKKPAFYQYTPKSTANKSQDDEDNCQENGDQNLQNRKKSRILNTATINRGFSPTSEAFKERMQILSGNNAKSKQPQSNKDIPVSPLKGMFQIGKQSTASTDACSPTTKNQIQAVQFRFSQEMYPNIVGQNSATAIPQNQGKAQQQNQQQQQQYLDQFSSLDQQRGRNAKVLFDEKGSPQLQSQDSVSSQTRLGTEETNSRNENTDNQMNGISNILSSRNASHNRSSNHNNGVALNNGNNSNNNQHTNSFLSSTNEELNSNERALTFTPQRAHNQISIQNCEFEDSPQIGKKIKNNSRSVIESTPSKSCETYQRLSNNFNSFQVGVGGNNHNSNSILGLGTTAVPSLANKGSFLQGSITSIDGSPQQKAILKGIGTPQFNRDIKSQYSFIGGGTPSSSGSIKSDYQDSPNLPHNFPNVYVKHESPQNRLQNNVKQRNHRNLSQFSIPKSTQDANIETNQQDNANGNNTNNNNNVQPSSLLQENNFSTDSPKDQYQQQSVINRIPQQKSIYQLQVAQQLLTNHQPFKTPSQQAIGSFKQIQIEENPQASSRQTRSSTCNVPVQFPAGSQGNLPETAAQTLPSNTAKNPITIDPAPYTPFFAQTTATNSINRTNYYNSSLNSAPNQNSIRIRGLNTSIDFNMNQQPSQPAVVAQNTTKSLKILSPSQKSASNHLSNPQMPQVQAQNNLPSSSFANSSFHNRNQNIPIPNKEQQQPAPPVKVISLLAESQKKLIYPQQKLEQPYNLANSYDMTAMSTTQSATNLLTSSFDNQKQTPIVGINIFSPKTNAASVTKTPEYTPYSTSSSSNIPSMIPPNKQSPAGITSPTPSTYQTYNKANQVYKSLSSISDVLDQKQILANSNKSTFISAEFAQSNQILNKNNPNTNNVPSENTIAPPLMASQGNFFSMPGQFFNTFDNSRNYAGGSITFLQTGKYGTEIASNVSSNGFGANKTKQ